jgi:UDP-N-acetylglucosamine 2-epimerase (non-hydrolysing)
MMFCPTSQAVSNLLVEGVDSSKVFLVGNTVVDAVLSVTKDFHKTENSGIINILATMHRRENHGNNLLKFCNALKTLSQNNKNMEILFPVHQNPNVQNIVHSELAGIDNIKLTKPMEYKPFIRAMANADLILTDSGGVQEEVATLCKHAFILRNNTERQEALSETIKILGNETDAIVSAVEIFLKGYSKNTSSLLEYNYTFGNGKSAEKIVKILEEKLA